MVKSGGAHSPRCQNGRVSTTALPVVGSRLDRRWSGLPRPARVTLTVLPILLAAFVVYLWAHEVVGPHHHQFDLQIYYRAVNYWADGFNIYDYAQYDSVNITLGWTYPPLAAVLMSPMALLGYPVVKAISLTGIVLATAGCVALVLRERVRIPADLAVLVVGVATAAAFLLEPLRQTLGFGQINMYLMLLILLDLLVLARRGSRWTGVGVGLAMAIKLTPGIFLLYFVATRQWRALIVSVVSAAAATLAAALVLPRESWQFFTALLWDTDRVGFLGGSANQSVNGILARFVAPEAPSTLLWASLSAALVVVGYRRVRRAVRTGDTLAAITLIGLLGVLISPASWPHHIVWVLPAVVILGAALRRHWVEVGARGLTTAALARADLRRLAGPLALVATGLPIWGSDTRIVMGLPDVDYSALSGFAMLAGSLQMLWVLAALFLLPITPSADPASPRTREDQQPQPADAG